MTRKEFWEQGAPEKAKQQIQGAAIAAFVSAGITTILAILINRFMLIDAVLICGLGFGILKLQSRVCAICICSYFILDKIATLGTMTISSIIVAAVFIYYFIMGVIGTWNYQKAWQETKNAMIS